MTCDLRYALLVQFIGLIAFYYLVSSAFRKDKEEILAYQMIANFFFTVHYLFLDAYSGAITSLIILIRNTCFYKFSKNQKVLSILFLVVFIILGIFTFNKLYSILPIIGACIYTLSMQGNKKILISGGIFNSICWFTYNLFAASYVGMFTEATLQISSLIALYRIKNEKNKKAKKN